MKRVNLEISPEMEERLEGLKREYGAGSKAETIRKAIAWQALLGETRSSNLPIVITDDGIEIYNASALALSKSTEILSESKMQIALDIGVASENGK